MGNQVAWAMAVVVIVAVVAILLYLNMQQRQAMQQTNDPGRLLGQGIGNVVQGVVGLAMGHQQ